MQPLNRPPKQLVENDAAGLSDSAGGGRENTGEAPDASNRSAAMLSDRILESFVTRPERLAAFFDMLRNDLGTQLAAMNAAYEAGDLKALHDAAHAAKGVAQGLRDQSLSRQAEEIERRVHDGDCSGIGELLSGMRASYRLLQN